MSTRPLNEEQLKAVQFEQGPLLIIAGAGTGKTTVITERISNLILSNKIRPDKILALTFTEKAALEMEERVDQLMLYGYTNLWISTFHSFCDRILRLEGIQIGIDPSYRLMTEADAILFLRKNIFKLELDYFRPLGNPTKFLESLLSHFSRLSDEDITPKEYEHFAHSLLLELEKKDITDDRKLEIKKINELSNAYKTYEELKITENVIDFSNLISLTLRLFRTRPNILKAYQNQFEYILVDEFQDTNFAQNELAIMLAGDKKNITVVADDDQAIYRWRGAALSNVMQFRNNFPHVTLISLTKNYRSTQEILNKSYQLIQHNNPYRLEAIEKISKKLVSNTLRKGEPIHHIHTNSVELEIESIAEEITNLVGKKKYNYSDIAILIRANNHAQSLTQIFDRYKIPYQLLGKSFLFQQNIVKDLIAYLRLLTNLDDSVSLFRVLSMSIFNLSVRDIHYLLSISKKNNNSLFETFDKLEELTISDDVKNKLLEIKNILLIHLEQTKKQSGGQILYNFLHDTGLLKSFLNVTTEKQVEDILHVTKFFDAIKKYEMTTSDKSIFSLIEWVDLMMDVGESPILAPTESKSNAVNILTIHASKGLEFPIVFMINLVSDRFPTRERKERIPIPENLVKEIVPPEDYHEMEERRLFYVGMTRAKELLYFTSASFYGEGKREKKLSPFIHEALGSKKISPSPSSLISTQLSLVEATRGYDQSKETNILKTEENVLLTSISYSQIFTFDICPLHFKARYILNIPTPQIASMSYGTSLHNTLSDFYTLRKQGIISTEKDFQKLLRKNWISEGYQEKAHEKHAYKSAEEIIENYYKKYFNVDNIPLEVEVPFSFHIKKLDNSLLRITGKIDRIDLLSNNRIEIIDYKTGSPSASNKSNYKFQLGLYALAATKIEDERIKRNIEDITVTLFYIESDKKISNILTKKDIGALEDKIKIKVEEIENSDFSCNKNILCANCEYKMLCNVT